MSSTIGYRLSNSNKGISKFALFSRPRTVILNKIMYSTDE